eukprot:1172038-Pleurochrysis_carterae.AAC.2
MFRALGVGIFHALPRLSLCSSLAIGLHRLAWYDIPAVALRSGTWRGNRGGLYALYYVVRAQSSTV